MTWPTYPLGQLADTALGKMLDKGKPKGLPHVPYLRNVNVQWGRVDTSSVWTMELGEHEHERFGLRAGDLLICEGGEPGRCAVWQGSSEFTAFQKALHRARPGPNLTTGFLRYYLEHLVSSGAIAKFCTGSTIAHLPQQQLRRVPVPLPPVAEQRRIVEILEEHLSHLDASEVELQRSGTRLEVLWASTLSNSRSGIQVALPAVTEIQGGIQKQPKRAPVANHYPFLRVANVTATGLDLRDVHRVELFGDELERLRLLPGDLLVVEGNGSPAQIGRAAAWDGSIDNCVHQNHLIRVRPLPGLLPGYLEAVWNSPEHRRTLTDVSSSSSGLHTLSVSKLKRLSIPVPSLETQADLLSRVQEVRSALDRQRTAISGAIAKGRALRRAVLAAAFEGKLTGRHTDVEVLEELAEA